ncbi:MAG: FAD-binding oxidoreductase [Acidisphaera sp.]|nr:FAD-binding oxidoreductase [Acidisphaera sp.]
MPEPPASGHPAWQARPYWWDEVPPVAAHDTLPERTDVAIIGSGYAALSAARILGRHGLAVTVLDAREPGYGASTRNHGMVGGGLKIPGDLEQRLGRERADRIRKNARDSFIEFKQIIADENLAVDYSNSGRFTGAHTPAAYKRQAARGEELRRNFGYHTRMLPREEQHSEIGSDFYYGALLVEESGGLQPAKLHRAYLRLAEQAGGRIVGNAEVGAIEGRHGAFTLRTAKGDLRAEKVFVATNAYTGAINPHLSPFVRRRVVPVTAYMAATEELPEDVARFILPTNRMCGDTKRSLFAFRLSPDRRRMIFAGRARWRDIDEREATPILHRFMTEVWPVLKEYRVTHCWKGLVCFTFDKLPHMGEIDGLYYAAGCQGSGVVMMSYLGRQVAEKIISGAREQCGFDGLPFPARPGYTGKPWFLPVVGGYYKTRDALERRLVWADR